MYQEKVRSISFEYSYYYTQTQRKVVKALLINIEIIPRDL